MVLFIEEVLEAVGEPEVWPALEKLVDPVTRGDPESTLRWTGKGTHVLAAEPFTQHGIGMSDRTVARLRRDHDHSLQAPNKVEHRLFSFISIDERDRPLRTYETVVDLISSVQGAAGVCAGKPLSSNFWRGLF